jgi:hypothetical protein
MSETGVVKFRYESNGKALAPFFGFEEVNAAREELRALGLLGVDQNDVGFGNVSLRDGTTDSFYITGSGTGCRDSLGLEHYAKVLTWDLTRNWLQCEGSAVPSAESLTHGALYGMNRSIKVVLHGHSRVLWHRLLDDGIATGSEIPYGTPEMAREVERLIHETKFARTQLFAMAGHENGIIAFGHTFSDALENIRSRLLQ